MTAKQTEAATTPASQTEQGRQDRQPQQENPGGNQSQPQQQSQTRQEAQGMSGEQRQDNRLARRDAGFISPFALLQRFFSDDLASFFGDSAGGGISSQRGAGTDVAWMPKVDVVQRGNELVVRADLPGVKPDDVTVEIGDDTITISGERQQEHKQESGGVYRFERTYGSFFREIPLPEGALVDRAKASFKDGVLEVTVPAPPEQVSRGRRLEISQGR